MRLNRRPRLFVAVLASTLASGAGATVVVAGGVVIGVVAGAVVVGLAEFGIAIGAGVGLGSVCIGAMALAGFTMLSIFIDGVIGVVRAIRRPNRPVRGVLLIGVADDITVPGITIGAGATGITGVVLVWALATPDTPHKTAEAKRRFMLQLLAG